MEFNPVSHYKFFYHLKCLIIRKLAGRVFAEIGRGRLKNATNATVKGKFSTPNRVNSHAC
jgi:hypothetical protein